MVDESRNMSDGEAMALGELSKEAHGFVNGLLSMGWSANDVKMAIENEVSRRQVKKPRNPSGSAGFIDLAVEIKRVFAAALEKVCDFQRVKNLFLSMVDRVVGENREEEEDIRAAREQAKIQAFVSGGVKHPDERRKALACLETWSGFKKVAIPEDLQDRKEGIVGGHMQVDGHLFVFQEDCVVVIDLNADAFFEFLEIAGEAREAIVPGGDEKQFFLSLCASKNYTVDSSKGDVKEVITVIFMAKEGDRINGMVKAGVTFEAIKRAEGI